MLNKKRFLWCILIVIPWAFLIGFLSSKLGLDKVWFWLICIVFLIIFEAITLPYIFEFPPPMERESMEKVELTGEFKQEMKGWPFAFYGRTVLAPKTTKPVLIKTIHIGPLAIAWISRERR